MLQNSDVFVTVVFNVLDFTLGCGFIRNNFSLIIHMKIIKFLDLI